MQNNPQEEFMRKAIEEAKNSAQSGQYALGSVIVDGDGKIIATGNTTLHENNDPTCHAEINAI
ncbi:MAG: nucleoside deaminase, partial [Patescibacteria group bacterium]